MSTIDIRDMAGDEVDSIIFGSDSLILINFENYDSFHIRDHAGGLTEVYYHELPDLIKALKKANELWDKDWNK